MKNAQVDLEANQEYCPAFLVTMRAICCYIDLFLHLGIYQTLNLLIEISVVKLNLFSL